MHFLLIIIKDKPMHPKYIYKIMMVVCTKYKNVESEELQLTSCRYWYIKGFTFCHVFHKPQSNSAVNTIAI